MSNEEIVTQLSKRMIAGSFSEVAYAIMMKAILAAIVKRMGDEALTLSAEGTEVYKSRHRLGLVI